MCHARTAKEASRGSRAPTLLRPSLGSSRRSDACTPTAHALVCTYSSYKRVKGRSHSVEVHLRFVMHSSAGAGNGCHACTSPAEPPRNGETSMHVNSIVHSNCWHMLLPLTSVADSCSPSMAPIHGNPAWYPNTATQPCMADSGTAAVFRGPDTAVASSPVHKSHHLARPQSCRCC